MENIISLKNINFSYEELLILKNVSLSIKKNSLTCFFGPNGGGKTTLFKLLLSFLTPTSGEIKIFNKPPQEVTTSIGYVPQSYNFDKNFPISVFEFILLGAISKSSIFSKFPKNIKEKANSLLKDLQLEKFKNKPLGFLSGGQLQRALIARALINDPKILILDEPTAHIDFEAEKKILEIILKLKNKKTILMVTHDLKMSIQNADQLFLVDKQVMQKQQQEICKHFSLGLYHKPLLKK
jgi:zinc transport system ATP-binding protein